MVKQERLSIRSWEENQIHEKLEATGANELFLTMAQEMKVYSTADAPDKKLYSATDNIKLVNLDALEGIYN